MNQIQQNKLAMYRAIAALLQGTNETSEIAALPARLTALNALIATIDELDRTQNLPIRGRIGDRDALLGAAMQAALEFAGYASSYARENGLRDLAERVDVAEKDFARLRLTRRPGLAQQVHDAVAPFVAQLASYGVTPATLTALQTKIDAARAALVEPRITVTEKMAATRALRKACADADELLDAHIDALVFPLRVTAPEFYDRYRAARDVLANPGGPRSEEAPAAEGAAPAAPAGSPTAQPAQPTPTVTALAA